MIIKLAVLNIYTFSFWTHFLSREMVDLLIGQDGDSLRVSDLLSYGEGCGSAGVVTSAVKCVHKRHFENLN